VGYQVAGLGLLERRFAHSIQSLKEIRIRSKALSASDCA